MQLRDYQEQISNNADEILQEHGLVYLALEVRTGKTLTAIATAQKFGANNILFVTKKKAINDIQAQAEAFGVKIFATNYEQLHNLSAEYDLIIIDEAHSIGAFPVPSLRAKELKRICVGKPVIYLSGTPTPESYSQIYHQLWVSSFSPFKQYKNFYAWSKDYVNVRQKWISGRAHNDYTDANITKIKQETDHLMITFTQEDAGFESFVNENILYVKMSELTYKLANRLRIDKIVKNSEGQVIMADTAVKLMQKLHQIYSGSIICDEPEREAKAFDYTKAEFIKQYFQDKKIAIFYKFKAELYILMFVFGKEIGFDVEGFNNDSFRVIALQIVSGREGINLSKAEALIFYNIDFSATSYWQARARLQTKDREKDAQIYWVFSEGGIEDKIYKAVCDKKDYTLSHFKNDYK